MNIYYLGSPVWRNNSSYPISVLHVIPSTTGRIFIANFEMADDEVVFGAEYSHIKESISHMNERKESGWINQGENEESLCQEWIPMM